MTESRTALFERGVSLAQQGLDRARDAEATVHALTDQLLRFGIERGLDPRVEPLERLLLDLRIFRDRVAGVGIVTAERAEIPVSAAGSSTTVITREQLEEMHAENVGEALRRVPGLHVVQTGRRGAVTGLFARGGESDFNLVMVDGVKVNEFGGAFNFAHLPASVVDRIEVVRGPQSAVYGLNAIGSVVHIITRRPAGRPRNGPSTAE